MTYKASVHAEHKHVLMLNALSFVIEYSNICELNIAIQV